LNDKPAVTEAFCIDALGYDVEILGWLKHIKTAILTLAL
jgi:hypothetical protein